MEAVASERYRRLVRSLDAVIRAPALRPKTSTPARKALPRLLERDAKRAEVAVRAFEEAWEQLPHRHVDRWVRDSSS